MQCPHCGWEHPDNTRFCPYTGKEITPEQLVCPRCGNAVRAEWARCPYCAASLRSTQRWPLWVGLASIPFIVGALFIGALFTWNRIRDNGKSFNSSSGLPNPTSLPTSVSIGNNTPSVSLANPAIPSPFSTAMNENLPTPGLVRTLTPSLSTTLTGTPSPLLGNTPVSSPTFPPAQRLRPGDTLIANYVNVPPLIDGNLGEWNMTPYPVVAVTYGQASYQGPADLSASLMLAWDQSYLYLALHVLDNKYVQNASGDQIFKGDHVEILLDRDLNGDFSDNKLNSDDYQLGLSLGSDLKSPTNYLWYPSEVKGIKPGVLLAGIPTADGYTSEAAIPWQLFQVEPSSGEIFGFAVSVSDNDQVNKNVQEKMVSTAPQRQLSDPTTWGNLYLVKP